MPRKDDNLSDNFEPYVDKKLALKAPEIDANNINLIDQSLDTESHARNILSGHTTQNGLFGSELLLLLNKVRFSKQEFAAGISISNIKYNYPRY